MIGDISLFDPGRHPDSGNATGNGLASEGPLEVKLLLCCPNKRFSKSWPDMLFHGYSKALKGKKIYDQFSIPTSLSYLKIYTNLVQHKKN
jgi:hypothetical protein